MYIYIYGRKFFQGYETGVWFHTPWNRPWNRHETGYETRTHETRHETGGAETRTYETGHETARQHTHPKNRKVGPRSQIQAYPWNRPWNRHETGMKPADSIFGRTYEFQLLPWSQRQTGVWNRVWNRVWNQLRTRGYESGYETGDFHQGHETAMKPGMKPEPGFMPPEFFFCHIHMCLLLFDFYVFVF